MKKAKLIFAIVLMVVGFSSCYQEPSYLYCDYASVTLVNNTGVVLYFSFEDDYCDRYLLPGEAYTYPLYSVKSDLDNPLIQSIDYKYYTRGYFTDRVNVDIDDCSKVVYIE